jgi:hypothetical protein
MQNQLEIIDRMEFKHLLMIYWYVKVLFLLIILSNKCQKIKWKNQIYYKKDGVKH